ncbi:MAG: lytic transglycosylase domain-containing protein [Muribaculaceae bacterium]|nr:lytic transglycosylase domain-containing protein [Muribaculaceae bacterium]
MNRSLIASILVAAATCFPITAQHPRTGTFAQVYSPAIPTSVSLCGEKIDLDRADMYEAFDRELTSIIYTHGTTMLILKRANRYFPELEPILKKNGVPTDLLYLACIESSLNPRAYSGAKAAGFWQFIPSAAKEYGLEVNDEIDERYNIEKATAAACRYLKKAYAKYGDWASAMASYNGGMTRISKALDAQRADTSLDLYLTEETTRYPYRVMAMKVVLENPGAYGYKLRADQLYQPREYKTVDVSGPVESWADWAVEHGTTYSQLRDANPWIRSLKLTNKTGKTYKVRIPKPESLSRSKAGFKTYNGEWISK